MNKEEWKNKITEDCKGVGTYKLEFDSVIDALSSILEQRDKVMEDYKASGGKPVISQTNVAKKRYYVKNPFLTQWSDLNKDALSYWRDLGLTPNGLRKIDEQGLKGTRKDSFEEALSKLKI